MKRTRTSLIGPVLLVAMAMGLLVSCSDNTNPDAITAPDLDVAAQSVINELQPDVAEQVTVADVITDAEQACAAMASIPNASTGEGMMNRISKPDYHPAIEAEGDDTVENIEFFTRELPYIVSIGKFFCPAEAVRSNVI